MTDKQIIYKLMKSRKVNIAQTARLANAKSNTYVWKRLKQSKSFKVNDFLHLLDAFGMECVVRPKGKYRTKYRLTREEE